MATKLTAFFLLRVFVCFVLTTVWSLGASLLFDAAVLICYIYQAPTPSPPSSLRERARCKIMLTIELSTIKVTTIYYKCVRKVLKLFFFASHCKVTVTLDLTKNGGKKTQRNSSSFECLPSRTCCTAGGAEVKDHQQQPPARNQHDHFRWCTHTRYDGSPLATNPVLTRRGSQKRGGPIILYIEQTLLWVQCGIYSRL